MMNGHFRSLSKAFVAIGFLVSAPPVVRADYATIGLVKDGVGIHSWEGDALFGLTLDAWAGLAAGAKFTQIQTDTSLSFSFTDIALSCPEGGCRFMFDINVSLSNYFPAQIASLTINGTAPDEVVITSYMYAWNASGYSVFQLGGPVSNAVGHFEGLPIYDGPVASMRMVLNVSNLQTGDSVYFPGSMDSDMTAPVAEAPEPGTWGLALCVMASLGMKRWIRRGQRS